MKGFAIALAVGSSILTLGFLAGVLGADRSLIYFKKQY